MSKLNFTPGEWVDRDDPLIFPNKIIGSLNSKRNICKILYWDEEAKANAKLIQAAPKMFKLLIDVWYHKGKLETIKSTIEEALGFKLSDLELIEIYNELNK